MFIDNPKLRMHTVDYACIIHLSKHAVYMDVSQTKHIADLFLRERAMDDVVVRHICLTTAHQQIEYHARNAFVCRYPTDFCQLVH